MSDRTVSTWIRGHYRRLAPAVVALLAVVTLGACGLSESGPPTKIGDKIGALDQRPNDVPVEPEGPTETTDPEVLVQNFLSAAVGGDNAASARLQSFMTSKGGASWHVPYPEPDQTIPLTVIRLLGDPTGGLAVDGRTPVKIDFRIVGSLNDTGLVSDLPGDSSKKYSMTFWVVPTVDYSLRIDQIDGINGLNGLNGPWISDQALTTMYRPQTIYFWDSANKFLIPDLRYLPLTLGRDQRAQKIVQWLLDAPSPWLGQFAQRLPSGATTKDRVTNENGTWKINLSAASGAGGEEGVRRLYYQIEMSLRTDSTPAIKLSIESVEQTSPEPEYYQRHNLFFGLDDVKQSEFDIADNKVTVEVGADPPQILKSPENQNVAYAAVKRDGTRMAIVRNGTPTDPKRSLTLIQDANGAKVDTQVPRRADLLRPIFVPNTDMVLQPSGAGLFLVQQDGSYTTVDLPRPNSPLTSVSVSPDGRRIAWVAGGEAWVAPLMVGDKTVSVGASPRSVLRGELNARAIAWTGEAWLYVVGASAAGAPVVWQTTVDSAVAKQVTNEATGQSLTSPALDVVALANSAPTNPGRVVVFTQPGLFNFSSSIGGPNKSKNLFYVT